MKLLINKFLNWFLIIFLSLTSTNSYVFAQNIDQFALPTGGQVVSGNIDINQPSVGRLDVNQTTQQGIVNWNTFNVGSSASVYFNQPTNKSTILNNVVTGKSIINGSIFSNGRLILVNPTGILMGPTSAVRAEGAILSTLNITNQNFLNNNLSFSTDKLSKLTASGKIDAQYVALISPEINNKGQIIAKASTALAAGDDVLLSISGSNKLTVKVKPSKLKSLAKNEGTIETKNGIVTIKADAAQSLVDETIKITDAKAQGLVSENGVIKLVSNTGSIEASEIKIDAGSNGEATISGKLDVNSSTSKGGDIEITGKELNLVSAKLSADGKEGGGKILIGGDWQGKGDLLQSTYTSIDKNSVLSASATESGAGGTIVAWSNIKDSNSVTSVYGTLTAKGIDGDGGQIETSGAVLNYNGIKVNTSSLTGNYGNWLLDPTNITIGSSEASTIASNLGTSDVTQTATNTITVNNNIAYTGARNATLTFDATTTVLNANISSNNGTLSIDINTILEIGASNTSITTNGGNVDVSGVIRAVTGETNNFTIDAGTGNVTFSSNLTQATGDYSAGFAQGNFTSISDLDFSGTFLNAANIGGTQSTIGDAVFKKARADDGNHSNMTFQFQNQIQTWSSNLNYGDTGLNNLMKGIRWSGWNQTTPTVTFTNATAGQKYKIQALFKERCCTRYFDVYVDGTKVADDFRPVTGFSSGIKGLLRNIDYVNTRADQNKTMVVNTLRDLIERGKEFEAIQLLKAWGEWSDSPLRLAGKIDSYQKNIDKGFIYEHVIPIAVIRELMVDVINSSKSLDAKVSDIENILNESKVSLNNFKIDKSLKQAMPEGWKLGDDIYVRYGENKNKLNYFGEIQKEENLSKEINQKIIKRFVKIPI